jgi:site-specific recombinase XerD
MREPADLAELLDLVPPAPALRSDQNPAAVYLARLGTEKSRRTMRSALQAVLGAVGGEQGRDLDPLTFPWWLMRYQHAQATRARLAETRAPAGANLALAALRGVMTECWRLGLMTAEERARVCDLAAVPGQRLLAGREVTGGELRALFQLCAGREDAAGARDAALLAVLYGAGLRRTEAAALELSDWHPERGELAVRSGKGGKERLVYLAAGGQAALSAWLGLRGPEAGPLLCPVKKGGRIELRRMSPHGLFQRLRELARKASVEMFSPHDLRRTFVSHLLEAGADLVAVKDLAGHASVTTTAGYDRRGERAKKKAAELVHVPFYEAPI